MTTHDVIIIGASLAGSACVRELERSGIDAVAFERDRFPRAKVCGGVLSPGGGECLARFQVAQDASLQEGALERGELPSVIATVDLGNVGEFDRVGQRAPRDACVAVMEVRERTMRICSHVAGSSSGGIAPLLVLDQEGCQHGLFTQTGPVHRARQAGQS